MECGLPPIWLGLDDALAQEQFAIRVIVGVENEQIRARFHQAIQRHAILLVTQVHILWSELSCFKMRVLLLEHAAASIRILKVSACHSEC